MALSYRINAVFVWKPVRLVLEFLECAIYPYRNHY